MRVLSLLLVFICAILMFLVRREYKLAIIFMSTVLLTLVPIGSISATTALILFFWLSELRNIKIHWKRLLNSVLLPFAVLSLLTFLISAITSKNLHSFSSLVHFGLSEVITKQFAVLYGFIALRKLKSIKPLLLVSFVSLIILTLFAFSNFISGESAVVNEFYKETLVDYDFISASRFRVQATFVNPFDYGYICVLLALLHLYGGMTGLESFSMMIVAELCCLFGVVTCNCRTIIFCYLLCMVVYYSAMQRNHQKKLILLLSIVMVFGIAQFIPSIKQILDYTFTIFNTSSQVQGSSLGMRMVQLATVLNYMRGHFLFGRGIYFFNLDLGWENGSILAADSDLFGLEGIYLNLLLERGIIGFLIYLASIFLLFRFIIRYRKLGRRIFALGLSLLVLYVAFSFMTGELLSTTPTYLIIGYVIAVLRNRRLIIERRRKQYVHIKKESGL